MHYYKRNIGDYAKKAGRLSILQHGVYNLLIDAIYDRELFPTKEQAIDWVWASTTEEVDAVNFVLSKFFTLSDDGIYRQKRMEEEIKEYQEYCAKQAEKGKKGGRPKKNPSESKHKEDGLNKKANGNPAGFLNNPDESQKKPKPLTTNHKPLTTNHKPNLGSDEPAATAESGIDLFERFYSEYPKKKNRGTAEKAFKKLNPDSALVNQMIQALESLKQTDDWKKQNGQFIPYPATWLNAKGWLDEISNGQNYSALDDRELVSLCGQRNIYTAGKSRNQLISELEAA